MNNEKEVYEETIVFKMTMCAMILIIGSPILYLSIYSLHNILTVIKDLLH